jgi:hypothetical protein
MQLQGQFRVESVVFQKPVLNGFLGEEVTFIGRGQPIAGITGHSGEELEQW